MPTLYQEVRAALRDSVFRPQKSRGQNFLVHERVIESIIRLLDIKAEDRIVEIGPGLGFLTRRLVQKAAEVWAVEIDHALVERLRRNSWAAAPSFHLIHGDILAVPLTDKLPAVKFKLAGNLPYSIATAVLFRIFDWRASFSSLVLMVQKEVADRIAAAPGTKDYGTLSVWSQVNGRVTDRIAVSPEAFFPRPKVHSAVLKIELFGEPLIAPENEAVLRRLLRAVFDQRRKTLSNNLTAWLQRARADIDDFLRGCGIDPRRRGETLSVDEYVRLAVVLSRSTLLKAER